MQVRSKIWIENLKKIPSSMVTFFFFTCLGQNTYFNTYSWSWDWFQVMSDIKVFYHQVKEVMHLGSISWGFLRLPWKRSTIQTNALFLSGAFHIVIYSNMGKRELTEHDSSYAVRWTKISICVLVFFSVGQRRHIYATSQVENILQLITAISEL